MNQVIEKWNKPLRKVAHVREYFILTILIIFALKKSGINGKKYLYFQYLFVSFMLVQMNIIKLL